MQASSRPISWLSPGLIWGKQRLIALRRHHWQPPFNVMAGLVPAIPTLWRCVLPIEITGTRPVMP
ncbi:hypothetical protein J4G37_02075 [Microvirga sp. 3-52]|nr:hypothetical protein [Microvirga sp. 3-52]